jgi:hypothetical protein
MERVGIFMAICNILLPFGIFIWPFISFVALWYIFPSFGILCQEKNLATLFGNRLEF